MPHHAKSSCHMTQHASIARRCSILWWPAYNVGLLCNRARWRHVRGMPWCNSTILRGKCSSKLMRGLRAVGWGWSPIVRRGLNITCNACKQRRVQPVETSCQECATTKTPSEGCTKVATALGHGSAVQAQSNDQRTKRRERERERKRDQVERLGRSTRRRKTG